jgi:long-chain acyl-CoA synthetase
MPPADRTLVSGLAATVAALGDAAAYSDKVGVTREGQWRTWSWQELHRDALAVAAALVGRGVQPGDRVAIMASNRTEHVLADLGAVHAGAVPMAIYATFSPTQIDFIAAHAQPRVLVLEGAEQLSVWSSALAANPGIETVVVLDEGARPIDSRFVGWHQWVGEGHAYRDLRPAECQARIDAIQPTDPVTILYTSGSTGDPKGVVISHANMWFAAVGAGEAEITPGIDTVSYLPYAHVSERLLGLYIPQTSGGHVHQVARTNDVLLALGEVRPMMFFGVPRIWEKVVAVVSAAIAEASPDRRAEMTEAMEQGLAWVEARQFGHQMTDEIKTAYDVADRGMLRELRGLVGLDRVLWAGVGGAPMPMSVSRFLAGLGVAVFDIYGMTETTASISSSDAANFRLGSVGRPPEGNLVRVADDGELLVKGPAVSVGYFRQPEATSGLFDEEGWLHTGDIGRVDEDGFIYVTDRKKELIITSLGKNIAPSNVEALLKQHPAISHALVYGDNRPYLVALLTLDPAFVGDNGVASEAVAQANVHLSRPEQVRRFALLSDDWSPETGALTATLKLRRRHLYEQYAAEFDALYDEPLPN